MAKAQPIRPKGAGMAVTVGVAEAVGNGAIVDTAKVNTVTAATTTESGSSTKPRYVVMNARTMGISRQSAGQIRKKRRF